MIITTTYLTYLALSLFLTVWVAKTLFTHGRLFLVEAFNQDEKLADSVNQLLVVGFYLINFGYICLMLKTGVISQQIVDVQNVIEVLSSKIGFVMLALGAMHFFNLYLFSKIRRRSQLPFEAPPVSPSSYVNL